MYLLRDESLVLFILSLLMDSPTSLRPHLSPPCCHIFTLNLAFFQVICERGEDEVGISASHTLSPD